MTQQRSLVLDGTFEDVTMAGLLGTVSLSRSCLEIVIDDPPDGSAAVIVKAGHVLGVTVGGTPSGREAAVEVLRRGGTSYQVFRDVDPDPTPTPLGTLSELMREALQPAPTLGSSADALVLDGTFARFQLQEILEVMSLSRQLVELVAFDDQGPLGSLTCKAGAVTDVRYRPDQQGRPAFAALYANPGTRFELFRRAGSGVLPLPIGSLAELAASSRKGADHARTRVLEGEFATTSLAELLEVVALSRQHLEIVFYDGDGVVGAMVVKAGQVLDARCARTSHTGRAAFAELLRAPGTRFEVVRRGPFRPGRPLGPLAELAAATPVVPLVTPKRSVVMQGDFDQYSLAEVLQIVSVSRQTLELALSTGDAERGNIVVRSGLLLSARARPDHTGEDALRALLANPGEAFSCYLANHVRPGQPIGTLVDLLRAPPPEAAPPPPTVVLEGTFAEVEVRDLFDVVGLSRQLLRVTFEDDGDEIGELTTKAGQLLAARVAGRRLDPRAAFRALVHAPGTAFRVTRERRVAGHGDPVAPLAVLLDELDDVTEVGVVVLQPRAPTEVEALAARLDEVLAAVAAQNAELAALSPPAPPPSLRPLLAAVFVSQLAVAVLLVAVLVAVVLT